QGLMVQIIRPLYDPAHLLLYPSGCYFTVTGFLCLEVFDAVHGGEAVEITLIHDEDDLVEGLNCRKFFVVVGCPVGTWLPFDIDEEDITVFSSIVAV
ncbi:hypothetical protein J3R82DRAFT_11854, partial [Butyriboletus roseoflavus]